MRRLEALRLERAARRDRLGRVDLAVAQGERSGKLVAELEGVSKRYGDKLVVEDFSGRIMRGDKVGLIGPNGSGKTTLLQAHPRRDRARRRQRAARHQDRGGLLRPAAHRSSTRRRRLPTPSRRAATSSRSAAGASTSSATSATSCSRPSAPARRCKSLSGGERNRLLLARLFARPANVLVLDEPTNDLDIETLELLEALLQEYDGTLFLVSHDRAFLDNVVTQSIAYEGDGRWKEYAGGYSDWVRARNAIPAKTGIQAQGELDSRLRGNDNLDRVSGKKLSYKESRELDELPARLQALEREQKEIAAKLADPATYQDRAVDIKALNARNEAIDAQMVALLERWEALEARPR